VTELPLIQIRGLRFRYQGSDRDVLRIPALDVAGRGMTAITGPSGVGKSTLIELLAGTLRSPYDGSMVVLGQEWNALTSDSQRQRQIRRIGLIPQDYGLLTDRTAVQMLDQDLADSGVGRDQRTAKIQAALASMDLIDCHDRLIGTMSGGQRQRVAIARMLARDVELVIADEPTANLDPHLTDSTIAIFRELSATTPVVIITHDPAVAAACDRTILLQGTVADDPYLDSAPAMSPPRRSRRLIAVAALAVIVVAAGAVSGVALTRHRRHDSRAALAASSRRKTSSESVKHRASAPIAASTAAVPTPISTPTPKPRPTALTPALTTTPYVPSGGSPVDVAYRYYAAINAKDWLKVWELGGDNLGETYSAMVRGYADTANDVPYFTSIDGSDLHLILLAYESSGIAQLYSGALTVSDGAIVTATQTLDYTDPNRGYALIAGDWSGHDRDLEVTPGGLGIVSYRTFEQCDSISAGCDQFVGHDIINGGLTIFQLTGGEANEAEGQVTSSTASPRGPMTLKTSLRLDTVSLSMFSNTPFCGSTSPAGVCGA
jgi:putative ABC transport system ATP-binding protein